MDYLIPPRGQAGNSDLPMAKFKLICKKENQRSVIGRRKIAERRRAKRQTRKSHRKEKRQQFATFIASGLSKADIKIKMRILQKERKIGALVSLNTSVASNEEIQVSAPRDPTTTNNLSDKLLKTFISPRTSINISTFNTRTLSSDFRLQELLYHCIQHRIQILAIQEHKIFIANTNESFIRRPLSNGWWFVYSSATKNRINASVGGVGFILSPIAYGNICSIISISKRILTIKLGLNSNFKSEVLSIYSPTSTSTIEEIEDFYSDLSSAVHNVSLNKLLIIMGDFNAQLMCKDHQFYSCNRSVNRNTEYLESFITENQLRPVNMLFQKPNYQYISVIGPRNRKVCLDYIFIRDKWINSAIDCYTSCSVTVASDHKMVKMKIRWKLKNNVTIRRPKPDYSVLRDNTSIIKKQFTDDVVQNLQFDPLIGIENYTKFTTVIKENIEKHVPLVVNSKRSAPFLDMKLQIYVNDTKKRDYYFNV